MFDYNGINPTKKIEITLKIINFILCFSMGFWLISLLAIGVIMILLLPFVISGVMTTGYDNVFEKVLEVFGFNSELIMLIFGLSLIIFIIFNVFMGIFMYKKNKEKIFVSKYKMIKKSTYVLLTYFLGIFGIHRLIIGDKKGFRFRLTFTIGIPIISVFLAVLFGWQVLETISFYLSITSIIFSFSLAISDCIIGLSKVANEDKKIYV